MDTHHRVRHRPRALALRHARLGRCGRHDLLVLTSAIGAYLANNAVLKIALAGTVAGWLVDGQVNDYLAGVAFMAYTNLLFDVVRPSRRIACPLTCAVYILGCGLMWEYVIPLFIAHSVSDPWDLLAYLLGGMTYWLIENGHMEGWRHGDPTHQQRASQA